jgi:AraC-like DNA-binding protein
MKKSHEKKMTENKKRCSINRKLCISDRAKEIIYNYDPNPELPVKKIAEIVDYKSVDYFIKIFKQFFGITPKRFRYRFNIIISHINEEIKIARKRIKRVKAKKRLL